MKGSTAIDVRDYCANGEKACSTEDFVRAIFDDLNDYGQTLALCYHADSAEDGNYPYNKMIYMIANPDKDGDELFYQNLSADEREAIKESVVSQVTDLISRVKKLASIEECDFFNRKDYDEGIVGALVKEGEITEEEAEFAWLFLRGISTEELDSLNEYKFMIDDPQGILEAINNNIMEVRSDIGIIDEYKYKEGWVFRGDNPLKDDACIAAYEELQNSEERMEQVEGYSMMFEVLGMLRIGNNDGFDAWEFIRRVQRLYRICKLGASGAMEPFVDEQAKHVAEAYVFFHYFKRMIGDTVDPESELVIIVDPDDPQGEARAEEMSIAHLANMPEEYFAN